MIWWRQSVAFVIAASVYANIKADWANSEAADNRDVLARLERIESGNRETRMALAEVQAQLATLTQREIKDNGS